MSTTGQTDAFSPRRVNLLMAAAMLLVGVANVLWAERLTINNGLGWDGLLYAEWTRDFYNTVFARGVSEYYTQRILPSAVVHYGMRLLRVPFTDRNIILGFDCYNLALLVLSAYVWGLVADRMNLRPAAKWFGFCSLFLSFAVLKNNFYHSVLTDTTAFALGVLTFYFFLADRPAGMLLVILLGGFSWPTVAVMSGLLFVFPYRKTFGGGGGGRDGAASDETPAGDTKAAPPPYRLDVLLAAGVALFAVAACLFLTTNDYPARVYWLGRILRVPDGRLLYVSIAALAAYLFFGLRHAAADRTLFDPRRLLAALSWRRVIVFVAAYAFIKVATRWLTSGGAGPWANLQQFGNYTFLSAVADPLIFFVAHAVWYGPAVILLALLWKPFCESLGEFGAGVRIFVVLNFLLSINPQSRFMINTAPVLVMLLARLLDRRDLLPRARDVIVWAALCLAGSKVWYTFNTAPQVDDGTLEALLSFPLQHYFANSGSWMTTRMYFIQGGAALAAAVLLYVVSVRRAAGAVSGSSRRA